MKTAAVSIAVTGLLCLTGAAQTDSAQSREYDNRLKTIQQPKPLGKRATSQSSNLWQGGMMMQCPGEV
jgi:hypothetical protein